jgi:hypothetical protein
VYSISSGGQPSEGGSTSLRGGRRAEIHHSKTSNLVRTVVESFGLKRILWHDLSTGKLT